ncbi:MAG: murein hydrolase activator EnvC family protein [Acidimicrobiales bacterium]
MTTFSALTYEAPAATEQAAVGMTAPTEAPALLPPDRADDVGVRAIDVVVAVLPGGVAAAPAGVVAAEAPAAADAADVADRTASLGRSASRGAVRSQSAAVLSAWPARGGLSGTYGEPRRSHRHAGIDIDGGYGAPVFSAGRGTVIAAGRAPADYAGYGVIVMIDHGDGVQTLSAHLSKVSVSVGQVVEPGTVVGAIGTTGAVTGPHLHFEVRVGGATVNPLAWLPGR